VLRGVDIDLKTSQQAVQTLRDTYERDAHEKKLSDEAIRAVSIIVRSLEGAMGKTAHAVGQRYAMEPCRPYFPLTDDPSQFEKLLEGQIPGLRRAHPDIADVFARHQPYQPGRSALTYLKSLYREHHHHDFALQKVEETRSHDVLFPGGVMISMGDKEFRLGVGPPLWPGIPVRREKADTLDPRVRARVTTYVDWYFVDPHLSVLGTLPALCDLCTQACVEISQVAVL
jgi:hypothetical protein